MCVCVVGGKVGGAPQGRGAVRPAGSSAARWQVPNSNARKRAGWALRRVRLAAPSEGGAGRGGWEGGLAGGGGCPVALFAGQPGTRGCAAPLFTGEKAGCDCGRAAALSAARGAGPPGESCGKPTAARKKRSTCAAGGRRRGCAAAAPRASGNQALSPRPAPCAAHRCVRSVRSASWRLYSAMLMSVSRAAPVSIAACTTAAATSTARRSSKGRGMM